MKQKLAYYQISGCNHENNQQHKEKGIQSWLFHCDQNKNQVHISI